MIAVSMEQGTGSNRRCHRSGALRAPRNETLAWGRVGVSAQDCHLHSGRREMGRTGQQSRVGEILTKDRMSWSSWTARRVEAAEGKGVEKDVERGGEPLWPSCR